MKTKQYKRFQNARTGKVENGIIGHRVSFDALKPMFRSLCLLSRTSVGTQAYALFVSQKFTELCSLTIDPRDYRRLSVDSFAIDYQIVSLFKNFQDFPTGVNPKDKALTKWYESEERCRKTNQIFRQRWSGEVQFPHQVEEVLHLTRLKIRSILGKFDASLFRDSCAFGPGSDTGTRRRFGNKTHAYYKYRDNGTGTPGAVSVLSDFFKIDRRSSYAEDCVLTDTSQLFFVLKTWDEFRTACKEPRWNSFLQAGLGRCYEERLRREGIDIKHQALTNRALASRSMDDGTCTIDLKAASDSTACNFLIDLLADWCDEDDSEGETSDWLDLTLKLRTSCTEIDGIKIRQEKISSMGNGFTFPLETLIFYSVAHACCEYMHADTSKLSVFGDDIVIPRDAAQLLIQALGHFGYVPNIKKTFLRGEFFESCGTDFFRGKNVRPVFLKRFSHYVHVLRLHNAFLRWGIRRSPFGITGGCSSDVRTLVDHLISIVPQNLRFCGPREEGDRYFHQSLDECTPPRHWCWGGYLVNGVMGKAAFEHGASFRGHLYSKLTVLNSEFGTRNHVPLREKEPDVSKKRIFIPDAAIMPLIWD